MEQYAHWKAYLHDLGACEVKHGVRVGVTNLYSDEVGNAQLPKKFQGLKKRRTHVRWAEGAIALVVLGAVVAAFVLVLHRPVRSMMALTVASTILPVCRLTLTWSPTA